MNHVVPEFQLDTDDQAAATAALILPTAETALGTLTLADAYQKMQGFQEAARSANTRRAYAADWKHFTAWCNQHALHALPAPPGTIAIYLSTYAESLAVATLSRRLVAISERHRAIGHPPPIAHPLVAETWEGIKRRAAADGRTTTAKAPILPSDLRHMLAHLRSGTLGIRDNALLLLGWYGGFRRSELVALNLEDISFVSRGAVVTVRKSKTDQLAKGSEKAIPLTHGRSCPVAALHAWIAAAGIESGPLFRRIWKGGRVESARLTDQSIALIVKRYAEAAGINPDQLSGHSLRSGFATSSALVGASDRAIMKQTGHKSRAMVDRYVRVAAIWEDNAATALRLD